MPCKPRSFAGPAKCCKTIGEGRQIDSAGQLTEQINDNHLVILSLSKYDKVQNPAYRLVTLFIFNLH